MGIPRLGYEKRLFNYSDYMQLFYDMSVTVCENGLTFIQHEYWH